MDRSGCVVGAESESDAGDGGWRRWLLLERSAESAVMVRGLSSGVGHSHGTWRRAHSAHSGLVPLHLILDRWQKLQDLRRSLGLLSCILTWRLRLSLETTRARALRSARAGDDGGGAGIRLLAGEASGAYRTRTHGGVFSRDRGRSVMDVDEGGCMGMRLCRT